MMAAALTLLLISCLLQGALSGQFEVIVPQTIEVLSGSCVTIPCSFDIQDKYESHLDHTCKAIWKNKSNNNVVFNSIEQTNGELRGILTEKDCTTTLNNIAPHGRNEYYFRLECDDPLKYDFKGDSEVVDILVKADPPTPTLTLSTLEVKEGSSVSLNCSAPAPCLSHPPTLTWSPSLGDSQETLQENEDKTKDKTSVLTFTASHLHHGKKISCTAVYNKQDGSTESSVSTSLTADISYSPKHTTVSVSPSGPVPENSIVTLTCSTTANPAVRNYTWYTADGGEETFLWTGDVLKIKVSKDSGPFFCEAENDLGAGRSNISEIDVQFAPQILSSSDCTKTAAQLNCSCETVGNPSPTVQWYLDGLPVNHSDKFAITNEPLNDTGLSFITVSQPQPKDLSNLLCRSSNSLGSATQRFYVFSLEPQTSAECHDQVMIPVFITTVVALLVLVCALLVVIRDQKTHHNLLKSQCTGDTSTVAMSQHLTSGEGNKLPNTPGEDIYVNTNVLRQADVAHPATISEPNSTSLPSSGPNYAGGASKSSEKKNGEGSDVIYSSVNLKSKKKKGDDAVHVDEPGSSYLEEERCMVGSMCRNFVSNALEMGSLYDEVEPRNVDCDYAWVKFKNKSAMHK